MSEDSFTLKEEIKTIREENRQALQTQVRIVTSLENIEKALVDFSEAKRLQNGRILTVESTYVTKDEMNEVHKKLNTIDTFRNKVMTVWSIAVVVAGYLLNKLF